MDNRCVVCGAIIPEGREVCPNCEAGQIPKQEQDDQSEKQPVVEVCMEQEYIGEHEKVDIVNIPVARSGACFHGESWVICPHCNKLLETMGMTPVIQKNGHTVYRCSCGNLFKDW